MYAQSLHMICYHLRWALSRFFLCSLSLKGVCHLRLNAKEFVVQTAINNEEGIAHRFQWKCSFAWFKRAHMTRLWPAQGKKSYSFICCLKSIETLAMGFFGSAFLFRQHHNHVRAHIKHKHKPNRWRGTIKSISNVFTSTKYVIESMCCCLYFSIVLDKTQYELWS